VRCLTINELWTQFIEIDKYFPIKYAVYHKLRTKGWVLKSGLKYGCDFSELQLFLSYNLDEF